MGAAAPAPAPSATHATPCKYFAKGYCKYGDRCKYSHLSETTTTDPVSQPAMQSPEEQLANPSTTHASTPRASNADTPAVTPAAPDPSSSPRRELADTGTLDASYASNASTPAVSSVAPDTSSTPRRGFSEKLVRIRELDEQMEDDSGLFKRTRRTKLLDQRQQLVEDLRVEAEVLRAQVARLDESIGEEGVLSWFQSGGKLLRAERRDIQQTLQQLESAIRDVAADEGDVPWDRVERALLRSLKEVPRDTALWKTIVGFVDEKSQDHIRHYRGLRMQVKKLWIVPENTTLREMEQQARDQLGQPSQLFHGTSVESAAQIIKNGFRVPRRHAHGGMFGKGIYFADTPLKSANYTSREGMYSRFTGWLSGNPLSSGGNQMLLCNVYLGRSKTVRGARPSLNPDADLKGGWFSRACSLGNYSSIYAPGGFFSAVWIAEYIVYEPYQAIPKFLIEFEKDS